MKKLTLLLLLMVSTNVMSDTMVTPFVSGIDLIKWIKDDKYTTIRNMYISGVVDGIQLYDNICLPSNTYASQLIQITYNYMQKNPTTWNDIASYNIVNALKETYPCKK